MFKKLLFALSLLCIPLCAQSTKVVPDCVIPFNFTATGSTSNLTCGAPNASPNSPGIASWLLVYESTGYSVLSLVVQSAPDNNGSPGTWGTFAGTVLSSTALPGSSGINPNTAITSAFTGFAGYYPWMRVTLSSVTGTGRVKGNLYGYLNSTIARAGSSAPGSVTTCGGAIAGQVTVYQSATVLCGIVQSAFDAAAANALVRFGPARSTLPTAVTNFMSPTNLEATSSSAAHAAIQAGALGTAYLGAASSPTLSYGMQLNSTSTGAGNAYAIAQTIGATNSAHSLDLYGQFVQSNMDPNTTANNMWYFYGVQPFLDATATISNFVTYYAEDLRTGRTGTITNPYYSWFDSRGVGRCRDDNTFNSVGQVICAVYNPQFTKYVAGAANFERIIYGQWSSNVAQIGVEKGGTGTLRDLQLIGNRILGATAAPGTNTTELATTAFVQAAVAAATCATCLTGTPTNHGVGVGSTGQAVNFTAVGNTGQFLGGNTGADPTWQTPPSGGTANQNIRSIGGGFDGGGSALTAGQTTYFTVPFACTIAAWNITVDTGTITFDVWKIATGSAIPTIANTITAAALPAISSGTAVHSTTLTAWTTSVTANDIFGVNINTVASATKASLVLQCTAS